MEPICVTSSLQNDLISNRSIFSYTGVISICKRLINTIQNNKIQMSNIFTEVESILEILRKGHDFELDIITLQNVNNTDIETTYGTSNSVIHCKQQLKRKKSHSLQKVGSTKTSK